MQQIYFCPNCRSPIGYSDRFCGNCGVNLKWDIQKPPLEWLSPGYDCPNPGRQQTSSNQQSYECLNHPGYLSEQRQSSSGKATPLGTEISKLLEELFDKRANCIWQERGLPNKS